MVDGAFPDGNSVKQKQTKSSLDVSQWIKNKIEDEGIQARNIIKYSVPVDNLASPKRAQRCDSSSTFVSKCNHLNNAFGDRRAVDKINYGNRNDNRSCDWPNVSGAIGSQRLSVSSSDQTYSCTSPSIKDKSNTSSTTSSRKSSHRRGISSTKMRTPSGSQIMSHNNRAVLKEKEYRARYWGQMLDTLRRTIDEIYSACETDESEVECKEVIMILEHSKQDFFSLIEKMNLLRDYEQADEQNKPNSLAWDERTTLPGKPIMCKVLASAAMTAVSNENPYISIPVNFRSDLNSTEIGDSDSDLGTNANSWCLLVPKANLNNCASLFDTELGQSLLLVPSANNIHLHAKTGCTIADVSGKIRETHSSRISDLYPSDHGDVSTNEGDDEDEDLSLDRGSDQNTGDADDEGQSQNTAGYGYLLESGLDDGDDDDDDADHDDNTLSRDLRQLDEAIANVTTAERVLSDQLDKAQLAEAALCRRLIEQEKAAIKPKMYGQSRLWRYLKMTGQKSLSKSGIYKNQCEKDRFQFDSTGAASNGLELDTDTDLLEVDSVIMDDGDTEKLSNQGSGPVRTCPDRSEVTNHSKENRSILPPSIELATFSKSNKSLDPSLKGAPNAPSLSHTHIEKSRLDHWSKEWSRPCCTCNCHESSGKIAVITSLSSTSMTTAAAANNDAKVTGYKDQNITNEEIDDKEQRDNREQTPRPFSVTKTLSCCAGEFGGENDVSQNHHRHSHLLQGNYDSSHRENESSSPQSQLETHLLSKSDHQSSPHTFTTENSISELNVQPDLLPVRKLEAQDRTSYPKSVSTSSANLNKIKCKIDDPHQGSMDLLESTSLTNQIVSYPLPVAAVEAVASQKSLILIPEAGARSRIPGHGVQMHEKLSARSRRKTTNSIKDLEEKQARARILRQQHLLERAERVHELSKKVDEVHMQKRLLLHQRRSCLERRLHAAERKRQAELERRVLKAHDEETKGREIAFIQTLEAEQKQHTILTKHEESQARLHELAAERRRRLEEKLGREEAAKIRRRALEASRRERLDALQARWESRAQQLASRAELLEHSRRAAARAKEQYREVKMASLEEQQRTHIEQLRFRIQRKQEESERRHQETLREISRKAFEMSVLTHTGDDSFTVPGIEPYPIQKWCRACQVMIVSEVSLKSHLHGKRHQNAIMEAAQNRPLGRSELEAFNLSHLVDAPPDIMDPNGSGEQEKLKTRRKRARKLRQRMNQRAAQFKKDLDKIKTPIPDSQNKSQLLKLIKDARRFVNLPDTGPWVVTRIQAMEKCLNALIRCFSSSHTIGSKKTLRNVSASGDPPGSDLSNLVVDQRICIAGGLLPVLVGLIGLIRDQKPSSTQIVPDKTYQLACQLLQKVCHLSNEACAYMVLSNDISVLVDCLVTRFSLSTGATRPSAHSCSEFHFNTDPNDNDSVQLGSTNTCSFMLMDCLTRLINQLSELRSQKQTETLYNQVDCQRIQDLLGYIVNSGLVDLLASRLSSPRQASWLLHMNSPGNRSGYSNHTMEQVQCFVLVSIAFLTSLVRLLSVTYGHPELTATMPSRTQSHPKTKIIASDCIVEESGQYGQPKASRHRTISELDSISASTDANETALSGSQKYSLSIESKMTPNGRGTSTSSHDTMAGSSVNSCWNSNDTSNTLAEDGPIKSDDPTRLLETITNTEVFGLVPLLYSLLLDPSNRAHDSGATNTPRDAKSKKISKTPKSSDAKLQNKQAKDNFNTDNSESAPFRGRAMGEITLNVLKLINSLATVNQSTLQSILGGELTCLLMRHILINLLTRCAPHSTYSTSSAFLSGFGSFSNSQISEITSSTRPGTAKPKPDLDSGLANDSCNANTNLDNTKSKRTVYPDDLSDLLPSGARQVVVRTNTNSKHFGDRDATVGAKSFGLPAWTSEPTSASVNNELVSVIYNHSPVVNATPQQQQLQLAESVLHEAILCVGHLCALNPDNQTSLQSGPPPTLLQRLVALPFDYFSQRPLADVLYPTLIACCYKHPSNTAILELELSPTLLANYIEERILERTMDALTTDEGTHADSQLLDPRFKFEHRFPANEWNTAKIYFKR